MLVSFGVIELTQVSYCDYNESVPHLSQHFRHLRKYWANSYQIWFTLP